MRRADGEALPRRTRGGCARATSLKCNLMNVMLILTGEEERSLSCRGTLLRPPLQKAAALRQAPLHQGLPRGRLHD